MGVSKMPGAIVATRGHQHPGKPCERRVAGARVAAVPGGVGHLAPLVRTDDDEVVALRDVDDESPIGDHDTEPRPVGRHLLERGDPRGDGLVAEVLLAERRPTHDEVEPEEASRGHRCLGDREVRHRRWVEGAWVAAHRALLVLGRTTIGVRCAHVHPITVGRRRGDARGAL